MLFMLGPDRIELFTNYTRTAHEQKQHCAHNGSCAQFANRLQLVDTLHAREHILWYTASWAINIHYSLFTLHKNVHIADEHSVWTVRKLLAKNSVDPALDSCDYENSSHHPPLSFTNALIEKATVNTSKLPDYFFLSRLALLCPIPFLHQPIGRVCRRTVPLTRLGSVLCDTLKGTTPPNVSPVTIVETNRIGTSGTASSLSTQEYTTYTWAVNINAFYMQRVPFVCVDCSCIRRIPMCLMGSLILNCVSC